MKYFGVFFFLLSCAQVTGLNMRKHQFGRQPTRVIWFQVAGLDTEQLAMVRFSAPTADEVTTLEKSVCAGTSWGYNLYVLRPTPAQSMLAQLTGKKDINSSCGDWQHRPIWKFLNPNGYKTGVIEVDSMSDESLLASRNCSEIGTSFLSDTTFWLMRPEAQVEAEPYLPVATHDFQVGKTYWDKTCTKNGCGSTLQTSVNALYAQFAKNSGRHLLIIRDFSFKHALERKNLLLARTILSEIDKSVESFYQLANKVDDMLVLVTGAGAVDIDFPQEGKAWQNFDLKGSEALPRKGELASPVFAQGARAENFCGVFEESQIFQRILSGPKQQGLELKIINPFN